MLRTSNHVDLKHPSSSKSIPVLNAILAIRKHNVCHQIQRHGFRSVPARKRLRMGGHEENRPIIGIGPTSLRRAGIKEFQRRQDPEKTLGIRPRDAWKT